MRAWTYLFIALGIARCTPDIGHVERSTLDLDWDLIDMGANKRVPGTVPGDVFSDLIRSKEIAHPFFHTNESEVQWVSETPWKYQASWNVSDSLLRYSNIDLVFKGLDTYGTISLNDSIIAHTNNMFRRWELSVRQMLKPGPNKLEIEFDPPLKRGREERMGYAFDLPADNDVGEEKVSPFVRKAGYHFGWDFAPRMVSSGIWEPIEIRCSNGIYIEEVAYDYSLEGSSARVDTRIRIKSGGKDQAEVRVWYNNEIVAHSSIKLRSGGQMAPLSFTLEDVERWWPNGKGEQNLHEFHVELLKHGIQVDSRRELLGFRTLTLDRSVDELGERFQFVVNGTPVFMKGVNIVPPIPVGEESIHEAWLRMVAEMKASHMNMVRVWGGGVYPPDVFYDACDRAGILVWQDFMFANTMVPDNREFLDNVEQEVKEQAARLRDHPSLALWCGNNEIEVAWKNWGWQQSYNIDEEDSLRMWNAYENLFKRKIPQWLRTIDQSTEFVSTSPLSNWGNEAGLANGDLHYWGVFHGDAPIAGFDSNIGRFVSEYGMQSYPAFSNLESWADSLDMYWNPEFWRSRQKSYKADGPLLDMMAEEIWRPYGPQEFVKFSQIVQARSYERAIKAHRFNQDRCSGTLYWQLNDVWPGASWSTIEHNGKWKASHYAVEKNYRSELMRFVVENDSLWIELLSDSGGYGGYVDVRLFHYMGYPLWKEKVKVSGDRIGGWPMWLFFTKAARSKMILFAEWNDGNGLVFADDEFMWVKPGGLWQTMPELTVVRHPTTKGSYQFEISTDRPLWCTWLNCSGFEPDDQGFALPPDRVKVIRERLEGRENALKFVVPEALIRDYTRRYRDPSLFSGLRAKVKNH